MPDNSEWNFSDLGTEAVNASRSFSFQGKDAVVFINTGDVLRGKFLHRNYSPVSRLPGQAKKSLRLDDILLTEIRPGNGRFAYVDFPPEDYVVSTKFMVIESKGRVLPRFLYHVLVNQGALDEFQRVAESRSGTFPQITFDSIANFPVPVPPKSEQVRIAHILDVFQSRLDLISEANVTLESIAGAIFQSWFVDFDPVRAKSEGREPEGMSADIAALFPSEFVDSELGPIPASWPLKRMEDLVELSYGKALKATDRRPGSIPVYGSGGITGYHDESLVIGPSIVVGRKGTVGSLFWEDAPFYPIDTVFYVKRHIPPLTYCYYLMRTLGLEGMNTDAAVPGLNRENVYRLKVPLPSAELIGAFDRIVRPIRERIFLASGEASSLSEIRDLIFPRLLQGRNISESQDGNK